MRRAGVLGTGLIGASAGMGLRRAGWSVVGWDPDPDALELSIRRGALDRAASAREQVLEEAELVLVAAPPRATVATLASLDTGALVTDVAGVKVPVVEAAAHLDRFVGGHPMAGRESSGPASASGAMFRGAAWVVTTDRAVASDLEAVEGVVRELGARPVRMTAAQHDRAVAEISHLPQVLAAALLHRAGENPMALELAAGSFRDLTRVAASDPGSWTELLLANRSGLAPVLRGFARRVEEWARSVEEGEAGRIAEALVEARELRHGLAPPVVAVGVVLTDRPGELARVGRAFEASGVDVRDIQLRHWIHGGGGVLTISVRPGDEEALREALAEEGFTLA